MSLRGSTRELWNLSVKDSALGEAIAKVVLHASVGQSVSIGGEAMRLNYRADGEQQSG